MAQAKSFFACFLFVVILFQELKSIDGRHLMLHTKGESQKLQISIKSLEKETRTLVINRNGNMHVADESYKAVVGNEDADPNVFPPPPTDPSVASGTPPPPGGHVDGFRPTAPGHSPGAGHSLQN